MDKRRIPEAVQRIKPDITSTSSISRSKPSTTNPTDTSTNYKSRIKSIEPPSTKSLIEKNSIKGLSTPSRTKSKDQIETSTTNKPSRFFSISATGNNRSRPQVNSITGAMTRSKSTVASIRGSMSQEPLTTRDIDGAVANGRGVGIPQRPWFNDSLLTVSDL